jgi:hypothetical protein
MINFFLVAFAYACLPSEQKKRLKMKKKIVDANDRKMYLQVQSQWVRVSAVKSEETLTWKSDLNWSMVISFASEYGNGGWVSARGLPQECCHNKNLLSHFRMIIFSIVQNKLFLLIWQFSVWILIDFNFLMLEWLDQGEQLSNRFLGVSLIWF